MRVAHIITRMIIGGAQENTFLCCRDLMRNFGDDVLLICGPERGPEGTLLPEVESSGIPLKVVSMLRRAVHPIRDAIAYRQLKTVLHKYRPDVVHTHSAKGGVLGRLAASKCKVPAIVHTVHGAPFHDYQQWVPRTLSRWSEAYVARHCHALVSVADAMADKMAQHAIAPPDRFVTVYSGMEVDKFLEADRYRETLRRELGYDEKHIVIGKVARLFHLKGHEYLIRAAKLLLAQRSDVRFLLVGDGILRQPLQQQIDRAGLSEFFQMVGLVAPPRIPEYLAAMDMVVHTSLREGLARVLPQALLVGRPVVSYDIDGAREVVQHGRTGYLLPPKSVEALTASLARLAENPELRNRMASEGRRLCEQRFRHEVMTERLRDLYLRLLH